MKPVLLLYLAILVLALMCIPGCADLGKTVPCAVRYPSRIKEVYGCTTIGFCSAILEDGTPLAYTEAPVIGTYAKGYNCYEAR